MLKPETRVLALDDCAFTFEQAHVLIIGAVFRGSSQIDGVLSTTITKDGADATERLTVAINGSRHHDQLSYVLMKGITFGGLNVVNIRTLNERTGVPVIAVQRKRPNVDEFTKALARFSDGRHEAVEAAGPLYTYGNGFFQCAGCSSDEARDVLRLTCTRSNIPEPLRVVHLIASGLSGDSRGRA